MRILDAKTIRRFTTLLIAVASIGAIAALQFWAPVAAQHGQVAGPPADDQAHFEMVAERLALTDAQREALARPFGELTATVHEALRLHEEIAAQLTHEQADTLTAMLHEHFMAATCPGHGEGHGEGDGAGHGHTGDHQREGHPHHR